jgi:23S rRNA (adenine2503-C2)-methyltransferase
MPINRIHPMAALMDALKCYPLPKKSSVFVEYVLIRGVNDQPAHAHALSRYLAPLQAKLNLIPYNPAPGSEYAPPSDEGFRRFRNLLEGENVFVRKRHGKGQRIMAACGQLGGRSTASMIRSKY